MAKKRYKGLTLLAGAAGFSATAGAVYYAMGSAMRKKVLHRSAVADSWSPEKALQEADLETILQKDPYFEMRRDGVEWYRLQEKKKVRTMSQRGMRIHAELLESETPSDVWIISLHGYSASPEIDGAVVKVFAEWGYNVLCPYLCGHGDSESDYIAMGWLDRLDVLSWIDYLTRHYKDAKIILHGMSMGGATVMMTTGELLPDNVVCAVEDCGYTSVWDEFSVQARDMFDRSPFPIINATNMVTRIKDGWGLKEASCVEAVRRSQTPTLFIHGDKDDFVPFWMLDTLYRSAACEKEKLVIPGAEHAAAAGKNPELYFGTIKTFIEKHLERAEHER